MRNLTKILLLLLSLNVVNCSSIKVLSDTRKVEIDKSSQQFSSVEFEYEKDVLVSKNKPNKKYSHLQKYFGNDKKKQDVKNKKIVITKPTTETKVEVKPEPITVLESEGEISSDENHIKSFSLEYNQKYYDFWVKYFTTRNKDRFVRHLRNGEKYKELVMNTLEKEGLPKELYYVALIESGFNSRIKSRASATGYWQFMKGTGKNYGLKINSAVDERTNIHKSTLAASQYFKDLYNIFGSWELALCAYNAGEYGIIKAIRRGNTRDYHELVQKKLLPKETSYYIPKVMAAKFLSSNLSKLNVTKNDIQKEDRDFTQSQIYPIVGQTTLKKIAKDLKLSYALVKKLNPDFNYKTLRGTKRNPLRVILPFENNGISLNIDKVSVSRITKTERNNFVRTNTSTSKRKTYKVRAGDNLTTLARKFGVKLSDLKYLNSLNRKGKILIGQRIKIPKAMGNFYIVRKGDNLTLIAKKFNTSISRLLNLNGLKSSKIRPRQRLLVPSKG